MFYINFFNIYNTDTIYKSRKHNSETLLRRAYLVLLRSKGRCNSNCYTRKRVISDDEKSDISFSFYF